MMYVVIIPGQGSVKTWSGTEEQFDQRYVESGYINCTTEDHIERLSKIHMAVIYYMHRDLAAEAYMNPERWKFDRGDEARKALGKELKLSAN